jgi:hypothetical protein
MSKVIPIHVKDAVLNIKDKFAYLVKEGGQNINVVRYPASIQSSTTHSYPMQTPSLNTVMSKNLVWGSEITLEFTGTVGAQEYLINPLSFNLLLDQGVGNTPLSFIGGDCPSAFPLNSLCNNMKIQINNQVVSQQINSILDPLLRNTKIKDLNMWNASTPTQLDYYGNFIYAIPNPILVPDTTTVPWVEVAIPFVPTWNSPFNPGQNQSLNNSVGSRSSFRITKILGNDPAGATPANRSVFITLKVREPIMCSPFLIEQEKDAGISGINMMSINCDMDSTGLYVWNWINDTQDTANYFKKLVSVSYANSYIEATYYTPKDNQLIPAICVSPLTTYMLFKGTPNADDIGDELEHTISSGYTMLNYYPESVSVYVANMYNDSLGDGSGNNNDDLQGWLYANSYCTITGVSITLGLNNGILSTYDITDLYRASVKSGSHQTFQEFSGQIQQGFYNGQIGDQQEISTCGSVLKLNFAEIIAIQEPWYAPGSLCNLQFKVDITYINYTNQIFRAQCRALFEYKGYISNQGGKTNIFISGVLDKEDVLDTPKGLEISQDLKNPERKHKNKK